MMANSCDDIASCYFSTHINNTVYEVLGKWHEIHNGGGDPVRLLMLCGDLMNLEDTHIPCHSDL